MANQMKDKPQSHVKHPTEYLNDLNPDQTASQNLGQYAITSDPNTRSAADFKDLVNMFSDRFSYAELRQMPIVPIHSRLKQGAVYLDLAARDSGPLVAYGNVKARVDQFFVPKHEIPYELWNRLLKNFHS